MSANKLLPLSRQLFAQSGLAFGKNLGGSVRNSHIQCVPPRNRSSFGEKAVIGAVLAVAMWAGPLWVLYHIPEYQREDRHTYTGK